MNKFFSILTAIFIALVVCSFAHAQDEKHSIQIGNLLAGIQRRAENLVYISEQEADVNAFVIGRNISFLDAETFRAANPKLLFEPIEDFDPETFFARLERKDKAWTRLRNYLETHLIGLKIFKVGIVRRDIYAVGLFRGRIIGIRTFAIET